MANETKQTNTPAPNTVQAQPGRVRGVATVIRKEDK